LTLDYSQGGILREHNVFKIIMKTIASNPGADKREKGILGQIVHRVSLVLTS